MSNRRDDMLDYLDGEMDDTRQAELHAWLNESPKHWDQLAELSFIHSAIGEQLRKEESATFFRIDALHGLPEPGFADNDVTRHDVAAAMSYVLRHTFTPKRLAVLGSVAAMLVIAVTLFVVMQGETEDPAPGFVNTAPTIETPDPFPPSPRPVATITATHNAQWSSNSAGGASALPVLGTQLHPNTRLTLTAGFAEITTNDGAIAILEAPATIELLDNNNALRLHAGKLVGICETESSKGFLVRTPHMDVTDLGTQFGVDASEMASSVHVMQGSVEVARLAGVGSTPSVQRLVQGEGVRSDAVATGFVAIQAAPQQFVAQLRSAEFPYGATGLGIEAGQIDPNWSLTHIDGQALAAPRPMRVLDDERTNRLGPQQAYWVCAQTNELANGSVPSTLYTIQTRVVLPEHKKTSGAPLLLDFLADNELVSLEVNGHAVNVPENDLSSGSDMHRIRIEPDVLKAGANTLYVVVRDQNSITPGRINYAGLRAVWRYESTN